MHIQWTNQNSKWLHVADEKSAGKRLQASLRFRFYFWLDENLAQVIFKPIVCCVAIQNNYFSTFKYARTAQNYTINVFNRKRVNENERRKRPALCTDMILKIWPLFSSKIAIINVDNARELTTIIFFYLRAVRNNFLSFLHLVVK